MVSSTLAVLFCFVCFDRWRIQVASNKYSYDPWRIITVTYREQRFASGGCGSDCKRFHCSWKLQWCLRPGQRIGGSGHAVSTWQRPSVKMGCDQLPVVGMVRVLEFFGGLSLISNFISLGPMKSMKWSIHHWFTICWGFAYQSLWIKITTSYHATLSRNQGHACPERLALTSWEGRYWWPWPHCFGAQRTRFYPGDPNSLFEANMEVDVH
jgi:hypothetical protein